LAPLTLAALRRFVVSQQQFAARLRVAGEDEVAAAIARLSAVQLDPLAVVERSHRVVIGSRVGAYPEAAIDTLLAGGRVFEHWAHERCLLPIDAFPLFRHRMRGPARWANVEELRQQHPDVVEHVRERLHAEGPLPSRAFEGERTADQPWKLTNAVLEALWDTGELAIAGRTGGQRVFDLAERVIPGRWLEAPEPDDAERLRELALRAVRGRGALTEAAIREHWRLKGGRALLQPHLDALVRDGTLRELAVEDGGAPVYVSAEAELDAAPGRAAVFLSPFDNLLWHRPFVERLFGFAHVIEIYKRAAERRYGYYVFPLLAGDRIVGRADLKADRKAGVVRVLAFHREPGVRASRTLDTALERALAQLAAIAGLGTIA
jgi:uncharacterized protein